MRKVVFFNSMGLSSFFSEIQLKILQKKKIEIINVVYSNEDEKVLKKFGLESNYNLSEFIKENIKVEIIDWSLLKEIENKFSLYSNEFNINLALQANRGGKYLSYNESLILLQLYYKFWTKVFLENEISFIFNETVACLYEQILSIVSKENNALYCGLIGRENGNFMVVNYDTGNSIELENIEIKEENERTKNYIMHFRDREYGNIIPIRKKGYKYYLKLIKGALRKELVILRNKMLKIVDRVQNNIEYYIINDRVELKEIKNRVMYRLFFKFDMINNQEEYYYYPFHMEPEAVVSYWAGEIYKDQIKLVENIAAALPVGKYLYVKDHPDALGYRNITDYIKLKKISNIKIVNPYESALNLIKKSEGVITITGTAGFEGLIFRKNVYTFGKIFYNSFKGVNYITNIKELIEKIKNPVKYSEEELENFISKYLKILKKGNIRGAFIGELREKTIEKHEKNIEDIAEGIIKITSREFKNGEIN